MYEVRSWRKVWEKFKSSAAVLSRGKGMGSLRMRDEKQICTSDLLNFTFYMMSILVYETYKGNRPS